MSPAPRRKTTRKTATPRRARAPKIAVAAIPASPGFEHFVRDVRTFLAAFERHSVKPIASGTIGKKALQRIVPTLVQGEDDYAGFLGQFLTDRRALVAANDRWEVSRPNALRLWSGDRLLRTAFTFWVRTPSWNESLADPDVLSAVRREFISPDPTLEARRRRVCEELRGTESPVEFAALLGRLDRALPGRRGDTGGSSAGRISGTEALRRILDGPLAWLGLVESVNGGESYQVTPLGAAVLEESWESIEPQSWNPLAHEDARVTIQPNLEILAPPDLPLETFLDLARAADVQSVDVYTTFEIGWESVMNALDRGTSAKGLLEFLKKASQTGVPDTVRHLVTDCAARHGEVLLGAGESHLEVREPSLLDELEANPRILPFLRRRVGDHLVFLEATADLAAFRKELRKAGYSVHASGPEKVKTTASGVRLTLSDRELEEAFAAVRLAMKVAREADPDFDLSGLASLEETLRLELTNREDSAAQDRARELEALLETILAEPTQPTPPAAPRDGQVVGSEKILELLLAAVESRTPVEIEYDGFQGITHRVVEPESFDGRYLTAFCRLRGDKRTFNTAKIVWAQTAR